MTPLEILIGGRLDPSGNEGRQLRTDTDLGRAVRLRRGRFVQRAPWEEADGRQRHLARLAVVLPEVSERLVVSHASAVAVLDLPWVGPFPDQVTVLDPRRDRGQRRPNLVKVGARGRRILSGVVDGVRVTDLVSTAVDVALREHRLAAAAVVDAVITHPLITTDRLLAELAARPAARASARAAATIEFADGGSGSAAESVVRRHLADLGAPAPVLQQAFHDRDGPIGRVDFWFPDEGAILEFDGRIKYIDARFRNGRSPERVLLDEKRREDRLRAVQGVRTLRRVGWRDSMPGGALPLILLDAGIPLASDWAIRWSALRP